MDAGMVAVLTTTSLAALAGFWLGGTLVGLPLGLAAFFWADTIRMRRETDGLHAEMMRQMEAEIERLRRIGRDASAN